MSLKCSVLGCDFGEAERIEERERGADEVIVTTRTVQECERCGDVRVLSENKEVTAIEDARSGDADEAGREPRAEAGGTEPAGSDEPSLSQVGDPWESVESTPDASAHIESVGDDGPDRSPDDEDAIIIEETSESPEAATDPGDPEPTVDHAPETEWADAGAPSGPSVDTEYACPACGFAEPSLGTSVREGDVCPECHDDYLEERPVEQ